MGPHGQLDSIKLKFPGKAIPGSVGAVVYLTGESVVESLAYKKYIIFFFESIIFRLFPADCQNSRKI